MIRIVGIQRDDEPSSEFVLLQNQGGLRVNLRGHVVIADTAIDGKDLTSTAHVFADDVLIPPGMYVILFTGSGTSRWCKTKEGGLVYYAYMGRPFSVWTEVTGPVHLLSTQHTYTPRGENLTVR